jgi:hypothetical protein
MLRGDINEVNGLGATEVLFTPTLHELLLLVKHYALLELSWMFGDFLYCNSHFNPPGVGPRISLAVD